MKLRIAALFAALSLSIAACSHSAPPDENAETVVDLGPAPADLTGGSLKGTRWHLISMGAGDAQRAITGDPKRLAFIEFDKVDQRLAGSTGCNRFFGKYRLIGAAGFTIGQVGMTRAACFGPAAELERMIIKQIREARYFGISNQRLTIASVGDQRLVFEPLAADTAARYRCEQGRIVSTTLSVLTGHLTVQVPDGSLEDLTPEAGSTAYANGLYRWEITGDKAQLSDLTLHQKMQCAREG